MKVFYITLAQNHYKLMCYNTINIKTHKKYIICKDAYVKIDFLKEVCG